MQIFKGASYLQCTVRTKLAKVFDPSLFLILPGKVLQTVELCSGPSLLVQPGPTVAGGLAQAPKPQHLCLV